MQALSSRDLTISDVGVEGIDSKILWVWKNKGLLPHHVEKKDRRIWGKFSFIEVCWLRLLVELRSVGVGMEKLKEVSDFFHPPDFAKNYLAAGRVDFSLIRPDFADLIVEKNLVKDGKVQVSPDLEKILENLQFSLFSLLLYSTILQRANYVLVFDGQKNFDLLDVEKIQADPLMGFEDLIKLLNKPNSVLINIRSIIMEISKTHEYFSSKPELSQKISESSVELLKKQFAENNVEEVTIRTSKDGRPVVHLSRPMNFDDLDQEIRKLTKKGTFRDIIIKSRDGRLKYFERTEVIRL
ncbi:MAG: hypothetical protein FJZ66_06735 [Bacteroidetes bacterium]|nr:hypothetical protein [Bacteroidota bacterium]